MPSPFRKVTSENSLWVRKIATPNKLSNRAKNAHRLRMDISKSFFWIWAVFTVAWVSYWTWQADSLFGVAGAFWVMLSIPASIGVLLLIAVWMIKISKQTS